MPIPNQTTEEIFKGLCQGMSPIERDLRQFCREATDEQLREVLRGRDIPFHEKRSIEQEIAYRRHKEEAAQMIEATSRLKESVSHLEEIKKPKRTEKWTLGIAGLTLVVCLLAWQYPKAPAEASSSPKSQQPLVAPQSVPASLPVTASKQLGAQQPKPSTKLKTAPTNTVVAPASPKK